MADCSGDCKIREYTYTITAVEKRTFKGGPWVRLEFNLSDGVGQAVVAALAARDDFPQKSESGCGAGCLCVKDKIQLLPYPKESEPRSVIVPVGGDDLIRCIITIVFTTYTGQCDTKHGDEDGHK